MSYSSSSSYSCLHDLQETDKKSSSVVPVAPTPLLSLALLVVSGSRLICGNSSPLHFHHVNDQHSHTHTGIRMTPPQVHCKFFFLPSSSSSLYFGGFPEFSSARVLCIEWMRPAGSQSARLFSGPGGHRDTHTEHGFFTPKEETQKPHQNRCCERKSTRRTHCSRGRLLLAYRPPPDGHHRLESHTADCVWKRFWKIARAVATGNTFVLFGRNVGSESPSTRTASIGLFADFSSSVVSTRTTALARGEQRSVREHDNGWAEREQASERVPYGVRMFSTTMWRS